MELTSFRTLCGSGLIVSPFALGTMDLSGLAPGRDLALAEHARVALDIMAFD